MKRARMIFAAKARLAPLLNVLALLGALQLGWMRGRA